MAAAALAANALTLVASAGSAVANGGGVSSSSREVSTHGSGESSMASNNVHTPHELLFANRSVSLVLLLLSFCWTLLSVLAPTLIMRHEQFTRFQVVSLGVWHSFAAGLLLAAAWLLFLPNMLAVASGMHLPTPALPFILLFLSMLVPLALDKIMLWMCTLKGAGEQAATGEEESATPRAGEERSSSQPSTPRRDLTPQQTQSSRKSSAAIMSTLGGFQAEAGYDERKAAVAGSHMRTPSGLFASSGGGGGRSGGFYGSDAESQPLTGNDIESAPLLTPKGTPRGSMVGAPSSATPTRTAPGGGGGGWYGSAAARSVDASEYKLRQSYIARCALCKDNITTGKGVAYHAAGCPLRSFHAFSFSSRWMQGLRGRRSLQRDIVMHDEAARSGDATLGGGANRGVGWSLACYVLVLSVYNLCLAGGVNLQEAARLYSHAHATSMGAAYSSSYSASSQAAQAHQSWVGEIGRVSLVALTMFCFTGFYGFSLGMMLALHRVSLKSLRAMSSMLCYALSLPGAIVLNYMLSSYASAQGARAYAFYLLVCQCFCVGILLYAAFLDLLLEEWARRDGRAGKYVSFAVGAGIVVALTIWAPL